VVVGGSACNDQMTSGDLANGAGLAGLAGLNYGIWTETDTERVQIMATVGTIIPTVTSLITNLDSKLPVAVSIIMHNANDEDAGLLNIDVWGYGNAHRAPLSRLSTFNLRIASGYRNLGGSLQYGKLLQEEIDVEGDCQRWLGNCLEHHGQACDESSWWNELQPPSGPHFRLIDVHGMRVVQKDMANLNQQNRPRYAALSYVWGSAGNRALNLHVQNLGSLSTQLEGQTPPIAKTIRDAIDVTRRLGLQYVWVDSLCIKQVVSGSADRTVRLWDTITGVALQTLESYTTWGNSVAFSPDGKQVVVRSGDKAVQLWNVVTGVALRTLEGYFSRVSLVAFLPNSEIEPALSIVKDWVIEEKEKILWLQCVK
jgi:hypothetical protein